MERLLTTVSCILQEAKPRGVIKKWVSETVGSTPKTEYHTDTQLSSVYDEDAGVGPGRIETNVGETTIEGYEYPPFIPGHLREAAV